MVVSGMPSAVILIGCDGIVSVDCACVVNTVINENRKIKYFIIVTMLCSKFKGETKIKQQKLFV